MRRSLGWALARWVQRLTASSFCHISSQKLHEEEESTLLVWVQKPNKPVASTDEGSLGGRLARLSASFQSKISLWRADFSYSGYKFCSCNIDLHYSCTISKVVENTYLLDLQRTGIIEMKTKNSARSISVSSCPPDAEVGADSGAGGARRPRGRRGTPPEGDRDGFLEKAQLRPTFKKRFVTHLGRMARYVIWRKIHLIKILYLKSKTNITFTLAPNLKAK